MYSIRLQFITTPEFIPASYLASLVQGCNTFLKASSAPYEFLFDPVIDWLQVNDPLLSQENLSGQLLDPNGYPISLDTNARTRLAQGFPDKLVVFSHQGHGGNSGGYSGSEMTNHVFYYINLDESKNGHVGALLHETGHYLHLSHTFGGLNVDLTTDEAKGVTYQQYLDKLTAKLAGYIRNFVEVQKNPKQNGMLVFEGDGLKDTPPDPGNALITYTNAVKAGLGNQPASDYLKDEAAGKFSPCTGVNSAVVAVKFTDGSTQSYTIQPDKTNVMSYYQACGNNKTVSPMQQAVISDALANGNRNPLLHMAGTGWPNGKVYFFKNMQYTRCDGATRTADAGYPKNIVGSWTGWPATWNGLDAAFVWPGDTEASFFRNNEHIIYNIKLNKFTGTPSPIVNRFPGWPASWTSIDAVMVYSHVVLFFRGDEYLIFSIVDNKVFETPKPVSPKWDFYWQNNFDCIITQPNGQADVFKGDQYVTYDLMTSKRLSDIPAPKRGMWPGITGGFDSAFAWSDGLGTYGKTIFFKGTNYIVYDSILHDTTGTPMPFSNWHFPALWNGVDAGFIWKNGLNADKNPVPQKAYFFGGKDVVLYNVPTYQVDPGYPMHINQLWPNWPAVAEQKVYAALMWPNGDAFLFVVVAQKLKYIIWNAKTGLNPAINNVEDYFKGWPNNLFKPSWKQQVKAVVANWWEGDKGMIYFFSGTEYIKYDVAANKVVSGFPKQTEEGKWKNFNWWVQGELV